MPPRLRNQLKNRRLALRRLPRRRMPFSGSHCVNNNSVRWQAAHPIKGDAECLPRKVRAALFALLIICLGLPLHTKAQADAADRFSGELSVHFVSTGESLLDIARAHGLGILEVMAANPGIDPWIPKAGTPLVLPTFSLLPDAPPRGIVINLAELRLYFFDGKNQLFKRWPIGIGREAFITPLGETRIVRKQIDPTWYPNEGTRIDRPDLPKAVPPGPDNPMGRYALYLGWPEYAIHGTNRPWAVGRRVTRGCIRLYPEDIEALYEKAPVGTVVTVVDQPAKLGWENGELYLEIHPSREQLDDLEETGQFSPMPLPGLDEQVIAAAGEQVGRIDWSIVREAEQARRGIPIRITR